MNIELKQAAQDAAEAIDWLLKNIRLDAPQLSGKAMGNAEKCASALRTALAQQPVTPEPVLTVEVEPDYWSGGHFCEGSKPYIDPTKVWSLPIGTELYTRPVPSLPDSIAPPTEDGTEYDYASGHAAGYAEGWNAYRDGIAWLLTNN